MKPIALILMVFITLFLTWTDQYVSRPLVDAKYCASTPLLARLKLDNNIKEAGSTNSCWDSLFTLQSCTGEVILFFLAGETYLGKPCCEAIRIIEHDCWPSMLTSLGYSQEQGFVLEGYCNGVKDGSITPINHHQSPPPPPPPQVQILG